MNGRDKLTLALLVALSFFLMCDLFITPAIIDALRAEYGVSEIYLSGVGSAFILVGAAISILFGFKADRGSRKRLLVITVLIGELPCLLTGIHFFTESFSGFVIMRVLTGIGVGGIYPLTFSLVGDYFQVRHRATASACIDLAWGLGMAAGPLLAGLALKTDYGWRLAFILAAVPSFPIVALFALVARDPERGRTEAALSQAIQEGAHYRQRLQLQDFRVIFKNRTNLFLFLQGIPGSIPWGLFPFWLIIFFNETRQFSQQDATYIWEIFCLAAGLGGFIWALLGDRLFIRKPSLLPGLCTAGVFAGIIPSMIIFNTDLGSLQAYLLLAGLAGLLITVPASNTKAMLMNVNRPEHRGSVFAIFNLADNIGKGTGPAIGGILLATTGSYYTMANTALVLWLLCGCLFIGVITSINRDRIQLLALMCERGERLQTQQPDDATGGVTGTLFSAPIPTIAGTRENA